MENPVTTETMIKNFQNQNPILDSPGPGGEWGNMVVNMTPVGQTPTGARRVRPSLMGPKKVVKVGCWNVRMMFQSGKLAQVANEFRKYNLNILGISECRWPNSGKFSCSSGESIYYSGRDDDQHPSGVALMVDRYANSCLIEWRPVSDRIISARFNSRYAKLTVIQCYARRTMQMKRQRRRFTSSYKQKYRVPSHDVSNHGDIKNVPNWFCCLMMAFCQPNL